MATQPSNVVPHPRVTGIEQADHIIEFDIIGDTMEVWAEIQRLKLEPYIAELEVKGYTVVPPEMVAPKEFTDRLRNAILDVAERRTGIRPDLSGGTHADPSIPLGQTLTWLLFEDPVFQEAMMNPVGLALTTYLLGRNAVASNCMALLKGPGGKDFRLHADNAMLSSPYPAHAQVCNVTWLLSDYNRENGALCFVPGSHKHFRKPMDGEGLDQRVAVEAPSGSMVFWSGHTWHGAFARTAPGTRINLLMAMMRPHLRPQEPYRENVTPEILARNPPRFAKIVGQHINSGWKEEGPKITPESLYMGRTVYD